MFGYLRLDEYGASVGIKPDSEEIQEEIPSRFLDRLRVRIACGEGVPVRDKIITVVMLLKPDPVLKGTNEVSEVELSAGLHPA